MKCLVLAFENLEDLPKNWKECELIDAYGFSKVSDEEITKLSTNLNTYNKFFEIKDYKKPKDPYDFCFIRHPDPWGEPRRWMQAIAALGECLKGKITCEFWFPHEIKAFDFLLKAILTESSVKLLETKQIGKVGDWENYSATWEINSNGMKENMISSYKENKMKILETYYNETGKSLKIGTSLEDVRKEI